MSYVRKPSGRLMALTTEPGIEGTVGISVGTDKLDHTLD